MPWLPLSEISGLARPPNYSFERQERDRQKAIKVAEKAAAKRAAKEAAARGETPVQEVADGDE
ncbi:hypothetical protein BH09PSE2_BH09PSE2_12860 [soil metagenome]